MKQDPIMTQEADVAALIKTIFIKAPQQKVWDYLTTKDHLGKWYQPAHDDLADGADYALGKDGKTVIWGRVLEWEPPHKLVTTFNVDPLEGRETTLTWTLTEVAGGTRLHLVHAGIVPPGAETSPIFGHLDAGWDEHLAQFRGALA